MLYTYVILTVYIFTEMTTWRQLAYPLCEMVNQLHSEKAQIASVLIVNKTMTSFCDDYFDQ